MHSQVALNCFNCFSALQSDSDSDIDEDLESESDSDTDSDSDEHKKEDVAEEDEEEKEADMVVGGMPVGTDITDGAFKYSGPYCIAI